MENYLLRNTESIVSPALIYYRDIFKENLEKVIQLAGGAERLWPHVKTHKCIDMVKFQMNSSIKRFKCATIAELEMVCMAGAEASVLAMPPAGPTAKRLIEVQKAYPNTLVMGIVDCDTHIKAYAEAAEAADTEVNLLLDVNMGMNRTGTPTESAAQMYKKAYGTSRLHMKGLHCYDGNRHESELDERQKFVDADNKSVMEIRKHLIAEGYEVEYMIMGGSPSLPCHIHYKDKGVYYSPGTIFLNDIAYSSEFPDLKMKPAAAILCRVISHPCEGAFTLDLGYKGISSETPMAGRGKIFGIEHCYAFAQSEEHWVFHMDEGYEGERPNVGETVYVIPRHVCPCAVLYPSVLIADNGEITEEWEVTARNRKINY